MTNRVGDADLVARAERGDDAAFEQLVERHFETVVAAANELLDDLDGAHSCAKNAFLEAKSALSKLKHKSHFGLWVYGISRRKAIYVLRRRKLSGPTAPDTREGDPQ